MIDELLKLKETNLINKNVFEINDAKLLATLNLNKEVRNQTALGNEYLSLKKHLTKPEDVLYFLNALISLDIKKQTKDIIESFINLFMANNSCLGSPFSFYNKFSFSAEANYIILPHEVSDLARIISFTMWTLSKRELSGINIEDIFRNW
jgi:hypothetical protein